MEKSQRVAIDDVESDWRELSTGVPQGSVLGLLFNLYINDMCNSCPRLKFIHYADDTTIFVSGADLPYLARSVNTDLELLSTWLKNNKLKLNTDKSHYMVVSNLENMTYPSLNIDSVEIASVDTVKFLGIHIDRGFRFKEHVNSVANKMAKSIGIVRKASYYLPVEVIMKLYWSLIYPHMTYGITVWGNCSVTGVNRIFSLQNKFFRLISGASSHGLRVANGVLNFPDCFKYFVLIKFYQCYIMNNHEYFKDIFFNNIPNHSHVTRFSTSLNVLLPKCRLAVSRRNFLFRSIDYWNQLPLEIKTSSSFPKFKRKLKEHLLNS